MGDDLLSKLVHKLARRLPFVFRNDLTEHQITKLVNRLAEPYQLSDAVERIELDEQIKALGQRAEPALIAFLSQWGAKRKDLLMHTLKLVEPLHSPRIVPALEGVLSHPDREFREEAARALGSLCSDNTINPLRACLCDQDQRVCEAALGSLYWALKVGRGSPSFREQMFPAVAKCLDSGADGFPATRVLIRLARDRSVPLLVTRALNPEGIDPRNVGKRTRVLSELNECEAIVPAVTLKALMHAVEGLLTDYGYAALYCACLVALGRSADAEALPIIEKALESREKKVYESAAAALAELKGVGNIQARLRQRMESKGFNQFNDSEKLAFSVLEFVHVLTESNLACYLTHPAADHFEEVRRGLQLIGAKTSHQVLGQINTLIGKEGLSKELGARLSQVQALSAADKQKLSPFQSELIADPDKVLCKLYRFVIANSKDFLPS
jgi:HEAT repeat protein